MAFIFWMLFGLIFIGMGIYVYRSKKQKAFGFWANAETAPVSDISAYNRALGKLWIVFGIVLILLGLPLLAGQNSPYVIISILGIAVEAIITMAVYTVKIEGKYRKK